MAATARIALLVQVVVGSRELSSVGVEGEDMDAWGVYDRKFYRALMC